MYKFFYDQPNLVFMKVVQLFCKRVESNLTRLYSNLQQKKKNTIYSRISRSKNIDLQLIPVKLVCIYMVYEMVLMLLAKPTIFGVLFLGCAGVL